jgi:small subunit ribosomal protein S5
MRKFDKKERKYDSKAVSIRRVAKVTSGGKRLRFSAMVVAGDKNGSVGVGLGRGTDTRNAIEKGYTKAVKNMTKMQLVGDTIPHEVFIKKGAAKVLLRPAKPGTGVIAGSAARIVLEMCGIENVYAKVLGSSELVANTYTTFEALKSLRNERVLLKMRNMQERVELKEQLDKDKRERDKRRKAKMGDEKKQDRRNTRSGRGNNRHNNSRSNNRNTATTKVVDKNIETKSDK